MAKLYLGAETRRRPQLEFGAIEQPPPFELSVMFSRRRKRRLSLPAEEEEEAVEEEKGPTLLHTPSLMPALFNSRLLVFIRRRVPRGSRYIQRHRPNLISSSYHFYVNILLRCLLISNCQRSRLQIFWQEGLSGAPQRCIQIAGLL